MSQYYKGFTTRHLEEAFNVEFIDGGVVVPYYTVNGEHYRSKQFSLDGRPLGWLGDSRPQIPCGLESLQLGGEVAFLTEGESCSWALRAAYPKWPVLGLPGSGSWKPEWARLLERFPVIYLSFDRDRGGISLLDSVWPDIPWARRVCLPEGADTRDVLQLLGGIDAFEALREEADFFAAATRFIFEKGKEVARVAA